MSRVGEGERDRAEIQKATAELLAAVNSSDDRRLLALWSDDGDAGKGLHVYRRQPNGSWKLALDIWNSDRPAPEGG
jgi:ketosteroid isomerase-like protein